MLKKTCCTQANPTLPAMAHKSNPWKKSTAKVRCERRASPAMRNSHAVSCSLAASSPYIRGAQLSTAVETGLGGGWRAEGRRGSRRRRATLRPRVMPGGRGFGTGLDASRSSCHASLESAHAVGSSSCWPGVELACRRCCAASGTG